MSAVGKRRLEKWPTGEAQLDAVLRGGLPLAMLTLIYGDTGAGKSSLAHQLARLAGTRALYATASAGALEAFAACFADPTPAYSDLTNVLLTDGLEAVLERLAFTVEQTEASMLIVDGLDSLLAGADAAAQLKLVRGLAALCWDRHITAVLLTRGPSPLLLDAAALVIAMTPPEATLPRRLRVVKYAGSDSMPGEHAIRVGALGIAFDAGGTPAPVSATAAPVTGLAARILNAFRTARHATPGELAILLGHGMEAVEGTLDQLLSAGYLTVEVGEDGERTFALASG